MFSMNDIFKSKFKTDDKHELIHDFSFVIIAKFLSIFLNFLNKNKLTLNVSCVHLYLHTLCIILIKKSKFIIDT